MYYRVLDPETPAAQVYGLQINDYVQSSSAAAPHTHNFCEFFLVQKGKILHAVNGQQQLVTEKQLCFVRRTDVHCMTTAGYDSPVDFFNIGIPDRLLEKALCYLELDAQALQTEPLPTVITLSSREYNTLAKQINEFQRSAFGPEHARLFLSMLTTVLHYLTRPQTDWPMPVSHNAPAWFYHLLDSMQREENFVKGIAQMRQLSNYSQEYINRMFRKHMDCTPTAYVNTLRVIYARKLILEDGIDCQSACFISGFTSARYFYKVFKRHYGICPAALKKQDVGMI